MAIKDFFSKISPMECVIVGAEIFGAIKDARDKKKMGEKIKTIRQRYEDGKMEHTKKILTSDDYQGFIDENYYSDAVDRLPNEKAKHLDEMMSSLAKSKDIDRQNYARRAIEAVATNPDPQRRYELVEKMAQCKDVEELINFFYARGWDRPDDPVVNIITSLVNEVIDNGIPAITKTTKAAAKNIKKVNTAVKTANERTGENLRKSGFLAWSERVLEKSKA